jgi:hypothetical protein
MLNPTPSLVTLESLVPGRLCGIQSLGDSDWWEPGIPHARKTHDPSGASMAQAQGALPRPCTMVQGRYLDTILDHGWARTPRKAYLVGVSCIH